MMGWFNGEIPAEHSIRKFFGSTFYLKDSKPTEDLLLGTMGAKFISSADKVKRYSLGEKESLVFIDVIEDTNTPHAVSGAGSVHHIAFRTANDEEQLNWREKDFQIRIASHRSC